MVIASDQEECKEHSIIELQVELLPTTVVFQCTRCFKMFVILPSIEKEK